MTQKNRSNTERRELWAYYTRLRRAYRRAGNLTMAARVSSWRTHLKYRPVIGDLELVR